MVARNGDDGGWSMARGSLPAPDLDDVRQNDHEAPPGHIDHRHIGAGEAQRERGPGGGPDVDDVASAKIMNGGDVPHQRAVGRFTAEAIRSA